MDRKAFALGAIVSAVLVITVIASAFFVLQMGNPTTQAAQTTKPALEKFKAFGASTTSEVYFLIVDAGKERGIWASNGLDPEFITTPNPPTEAEFKEKIASGVKIGLSPSSTPVRLRSAGTPVKVVLGYRGDTTQKVYVEADGPIKTVKDLDGKKIGVLGIDTPTSRIAGYVSNKFAIKTEVVPLGNLSNQVVALKLGKVDAFISSEGAPLRLVSSGELAILVRVSDIIPKPNAAAVVWATDDLIQQNPDLVKRFVKATSETIRYLKENPTYAAELYIKRTNAPKDLADLVIGQTNWTPGMSGSELLMAMANNGAFSKEVSPLPAGIPPVKVEDAVDVRFLP
ncbi:MAG: ABC transporter substrate-binding protein [Thaumarchaeota archaeon]|nr:ABC transporter substrate-binding protein [Nitrososphaerota archaeon]